MFANGIVLRNYVSLYKTNNGLQDLAAVVSAFSAKGINIHSLNTNENWLIVQTNVDTAIHINGIESF